MQETLFHCPICVAKFWRLDHLQRHLSSHTNSRLFDCAFCGSSYKRKDVLRKHLKSCKERLESCTAMPDPCRRGKKRQACDLCAAGKRGCDFEVPCAPCSARDQVCTYQRLSREEMPNATRSDGSVTNGVPDFADISPDHQSTEGLLNTTIDFGVPSSELWETVSLFRETTNHNNSVSQGSTQKFDFLLNFANANGLVASFSYAPWLQATRLDSIDTPQQQTTLIQAAGISFHENFSDPTVDMFSWPGIPWTEPAIYADMTGIYYPAPPQIIGAGVTGPSVSTMVEWLADPLFVKTKEIWDEFRMMIVNHGGKDLGIAESTTSIGAKCLEFFCPSNIRNYLELFWGRWYRHTPIIHRPTFEATKAPCLLLATMVLLGACMSQNEQDANGARQWLEITEETIFKDKWLSSCLADSVDDSDVNNRAQVTTLQAAFFICVLQNWEGSDNAKTRIRRSRHGMLVAATRELCIDGTSDGVLNDTSQYCLDWQRFIAKEEMLRIVTYVFLLDAQFVIYNNSPPRMVFQELKFGLTCPEPCFQSASWQEFTRTISDSGHGWGLEGAPALSDVIELLGCGEICEIDRNRLMRLSFLNLFTIVNALYSLAFQQSKSIIVPGTRSPLRGALDAWRTLWDVRSNVCRSMPEIEGMEVVELCGGFIRHAPEIQLLAEIILKQGESMSFGGNRPADKGDCQKKLKIPNKYDQTSMRQVSDLMREFQNLRTD